MDLQAERLINARGFIQFYFAKLKTFVDQKGILELLDTNYERYSLDFGEKMIAYTNWLADTALPAGQELKVAMAMKRDFYNDYCKDRYYRFKKKYTVLYGDQDTNYGDDTVIFTRNWVAVFTALNTYIGLLETKKSWGAYFRKVLPKFRTIGEHVQDTQHVQQLLLQLKQCIEEPSNIDSRYESYSRI